MAILISCNLGDSTAVLGPCAAGEGTAESAERDAVAKAIASRIETLDEAFLVTLQGFVQAAEAEGDAAVAGAPVPAVSHCRVCGCIKVAIRRQ